LAESVLESAKAAAGQQMPSESAALRIKPDGTLAIDKQNVPRT
jgi:hypothetical protein